MEVVEKLTADLRYGNLPERRAALLSLMALGPAAAPALPDLIPALRDTDEEVREGAAAALREIGPAAVPALLEAMLPDDVENRRAAIRALGRLGPHASSAVPVLTAARQDPLLQEDVTWALGEIQGQPLADLRQRLRRVAPMLAIIAAAYLVVAFGVWLSSAPAAIAAPAGLGLGGKLGVALAILGAGLGGVIGGANWGRQGALSGVIVLGIVGYIVGLLVGSAADIVLGPLGNVLGRK